MKQYCRYCANMVCGDANYCTEKQQTYSDKQIKQLNKCKYFNFNPIDALYENVRGYNPQVAKVKEDSAQISLHCVEVKK